MAASAAAAAARPAGALETGPRSIKHSNNNNSNNNSINGEEPEPDLEWGVTLEDDDVIVGAEQGFYFATIDVNCPVPPTMDSEDPELSGASRKESASHNSNNNNSSSHVKKSSKNSNKSSTPMLLRQQSSQLLPVDSSMSSETLDEELEGTVQELLSFDGAEHLLRAAPLDVLLSGCGKIFSSSRGTEATYGMSSATDHIGYFVSHNWTVQRVAKFLALAFKFNMVDGLVAGSIMAILCFITGILGWQPVFPTVRSEYDSAIGCRVLLVPVVVFALLFGRACHRRGSGPSIFLDKVCIHQQDNDLQRAGIRKLGAFLRVSDRMLVLYTPVYLKRLWTVYEVASFLALHDVGRLEMVPTMLPAAFFLILCGHIVFQCVLLGVQFLSLSELSVYACNYIGSLVFYSAVRMWAKSRAEIKQTLANFSVRNAECAVESDRQIVYANIVALMRASRRVKRNCEPKIALEAFNDDVRNNLAEQFNRLFGTFAFSHVEYIILSATAFLPTFVDTWSSLSQGCPFREVVSNHSMDIFWIFTGVTSWHFLLEFTASWCLHLTGWKNIAYLLLSNIVLAGIGNGGFLISDLIAVRAQTNDALLVGILIFQVVSVCFSFFVFPKICAQHRHRETAGYSRRLVGSTKTTLSLGSESSTEVAEMGTGACTYPVLDGGDVEGKSCGGHSTRATTIAGSFSPATLRSEGSGQLCLGKDWETTPEHERDIVDLWLNSLLAEGTSI